MRLYLVQHGKAAPEELDPRRPLTAEGRAAVARVAGFLKPLGLRVEALWHSGKLRAEQTAQLLAEAVACPGGPARRDGLGPNDPVGPIRSELERHGGELMIVGHLPMLGRLASLLLTGREEADVVAFRNGGVVCLGREAAGKWRVEWAVVPELLPGN